LYHVAISSSYFNDSAPPMTSAISFVICAWLIAATIMTPRIAQLTVDSKIEGHFTATSKREQEVLIRHEKEIHLTQKDKTGHNIY
jgi:hypothetical protein